MVATLGCEVSVLSGHGVFNMLLSGGWSECVLEGYRCEAYELLGFGGSMVFVIRNARGWSSPVRSAFVVLKKALTFLMAVAFEQRVFRCLPWSSSR